MSTISDEAVGLSFMASAIRDLADKVAHGNGSTVQITKAEACAIGQYVHDASRKIASLEAALAASRANAGGEVERLRDEVHDRFFWMVSPDDKGNHRVSDTSVQAVLRLCSALASSEPTPGGGL